MRPSFNLGTLLVLLLLVLVVLLCFPGQSIAQTGPTLSAKIDYRVTDHVLRDKNGKTLRSQGVVDAFRKQHACPATHAFTGACPKFAIDHVYPLDCGGVDAVWNMQWLSDDIKKLKDAQERKWYGGRGISVGCP